LNGKLITNLPSVPLRIDWINVSAHDCCSGVKLSVCLPIPLEIQRRSKFLLIDSLTDRQKFCEVPLLGLPAQPESIHPSKVFCSVGILSPSVTYPTDSGSTKISVPCNRSIWRDCMKASTANGIFWGIFQNETPTSECEWYAICGVSQQSRAQCLQSEMWPKCEPNVWCGYEMLQCFLYPCNASPR